MSSHNATVHWQRQEQDFTSGKYSREQPNEKKVPWVSTVRLRPKIIFSGEKVPTTDEKTQLHHHAHEQCFIANSVKTKITVEQVEA